MRLKTETIKRLIAENNLSQNQLAQKIGISKGCLSNSLNGRRGAGRKVIAGLLRAFPDESIERLVQKEDK